MSSLFSALTVAVGGLGAQSDALGNISDNLSNANTTGFKSIGTRFSSLVTQSNAGVNNPGGVRSVPQYQNDVQGNLTQSATPTSLAIQGQGFFAVEPATTNAAGATSFTGNALYTRQGDFTLDKSGYIVNGSGYYLTGWNVDSAGVVDQSVLKPIQVSALLNNPVQTSQVNYTANLPASAVNAFASSPSTLKVYDALGTTHDMTFSWVKSSADHWNLSISVAGGNGLSGSTPKNYTTTIPFVFNSNSNAGTISSITSTSGGNYTVVNNSAAAVNAAQVQLGLTFGSQTQTMSLNFGVYNQPTGVTQFADTNVTVTSFDQNGLPRGSFSGLSIDSNGLLSLNYSNGSLKTIAQVPVVQFYAQDQLQRVSGGAYQATLASGTARVDAPGSTGAGVIVGSSLEQSNVDIASQFTTMIQAQQIYSANAKTITTINSMLNTIIQAV